LYITYELRVDFIINCFKAWTTVNPDGSALPGAMPETNEASVAAI
jgi:hypothetical protein